ncbi:MAG: hypothetical protein KDE58_32965, partial [Caldilineaceae bacterium]|nr:hypothetical protein [Caldilineaceae bacterium]
VADEIVVDSAISHIQGAFLTLDYDAVDSSGTTLTQKGSKTILVTHSAPRLVRKVRVDTTALGSNDKIGLHRVDVDKVVAEPTVSLTNNATTSQAFVDGRFALRLQSENNLAVADLFDLQVRSFPSSPRIGVAPGDAARYNEALYFWQAAGEIGNGTPADEGEVDVATTVAETVQRLVNRELATLSTAGQAVPAQLTLHLLFESSAPCRLQLDTLRVAYQLATARWLDQPVAAQREKRVLRFAANRVDTQAVTVAVPPGATVEQARIEVVVGRTGAPQALPTTAAGQESPLNDAALTQKQGIRIDATQPVALAITPAQALTVRAIALGMTALAAETTLAVSLQESWQAAPSGSPLAQGTLQFKHPGRTLWGIAELPAPVVLSTQPLWLVVQVHAGAVVWLAETKSAMGTPGQVQSSANHQLPPIARIAQQQLLHRFITPQPSTAATTEMAPATQSPLQVRIGTAEVTPLQQDGDTVIYELTTALTNYLAGGFPMAGSPIVVPLTFSGFGLKTLTIYPPQLKFSL